VIWAPESGQYSIPNTTPAFYQEFLSMLKEHGFRAEPAWHVIKVLSAE